MTFKNRDNWLLDGSRIILINDEINCTNDFLKETSVYWNNGRNNGDLVDKNSREFDFDTMRNFNRFQREILPFT